MLQCLLQSCWCNALKGVAHDKTALISRDMGVLTAQERGVTAQGVRGAGKRLLRLSG